jgi:hypothetical protein
MVRRTATGRHAPDDKGTGHAPDDKVRPETSRGRRPAPAAASPPEPPPACQNCEQARAQCERLQAELARAKRSAARSDEGWKESRVTAREALAVAERCLNDLRVLQEKHDRLAAEAADLRARVERLSRRQKRRGPDYPKKAAQARKLFHSGVTNQSEIARQLGLDRRTVGRYLAGA